MSGKAVFSFVRKNAVPLIAFALAGISAILVPPDAHYLGYYDVKTLCCLFGTLAVVCALKNIHFFYILAQRIILLTGNARSSALALIIITFVGSMFLANDMALITFLPLGYFVFSALGSKKDLATVFILQNIAANLGGMLTPFGNPQNLYLYSHFNIPTDEFTRIMFPPFMLAISLVICCCLFIPSRKLRLSTPKDEQPQLPRLRAGVYLALFSLTILMVFGILPYYIITPLVILLLFIMDRKSLAQVDYGLLFTFVCFFTFSGNMSRVTTVRELLSGFLNRNTLLTAVLSCQAISNVPSAILLSQFTRNYPALLIGVNIGGAGTLIASLASLITFREYLANCKGEAKNYLVRFSLFNFSFLAILTLYSRFVLKY